MYNVCNGVNPTKTWRRRRGSGGGEEKGDGSRQRDGMAAGGSWRRPRWPGSCSSLTTPLLLTCICNIFLPRASPHCLSSGRHLLSMRKWLPSHLMAWRGMLSSSEKKKVCPIMTSLSSTLSPLPPSFNLSLTLTNINVAHMVNGSVIMAWHCGVTVVSGSEW